MRFADRIFRRLPTVAMLTVATMTVAAADPASTNLPPTQFLLHDSLGRVVTVATNEIHPSLLPSTEAGLAHQIPTLMKGASVSSEVLHRMHEARKDQGTFQWFPSVPPALMPYLAGIDAYGNTAIQPGSLLPLAPFEPWVQGLKYRVSESGLFYSLEQTFTFVSMTDVMQGNNSLGFYTLDFQAAWAIFNAREFGTAGWISTEINAKAGLNSAGRQQSAQSNLGTVTDPTGIWQSVNGVTFSELAWQQSLYGGRFVVLAGLINQGNYLDQNAYAQDGRSQFLNSALINTMVMPLPDSNFAVNLQWQPANEWYAIFGASAGRAESGQTPWTISVGETGLHSGKLDGRPRISSA